MLGTAAITLGSLALRANAEIVYDGSTGPAGRPLKQLNRYLIPGQTGSSFGGNLLHSFEVFDLSNGETARFFPGAVDGSQVDLLIARVTGGNESNLAGTLLLDPGYGNADLLFVNPAGIVFGSGINLDVPNAFYASTANELHFDGLLAPVLTGVPSAPPLDVAAALQLTELGFTDASPDLPDLRLENASLRLKVKNRTLGLAAQSIAFDSSIASSANGSISVAAIDVPGRIALTGPAPVRIFDLDAAARGGSITLQQSVISSSGFEPPGASTGPDDPLIQEPGSGPIFIEAGDLRMIDSDISAVTSGILGGGDIRIELDGNLWVERQRESGVGILARRRNPEGQTPLPNAGAAGLIDIDAQDITLLNGAVIGSSSEDGGNAGAVIIEASGTVRISGRDPSSNLGAIFVNAEGDGDAGSIDLSADRLVIQNSGALVTQVSGSGASGSINVEAREIELRSDGRIDSSTRSSSSGGSITVTAGERMLITGASGVNPEGEPTFSGISALAQAEATGDGGSIRINTPQLEIADGGRISAGSFGDETSNAGNITIQGGDGTGSFADEIRLNAGAISTEATGGGGGGEIFLQARDLVSVVNSSITATVTDQGNGGNITIDPTLMILQNGRIIAQAKDGSGGEIDITADFFFSDGASLVDASALGPTGVDGRVDINAPEIDLTSELGALNTEYTDPAALLRDFCAARDAGATSLVIAAGEILPHSAGDRHWSIYLPGEIEPRAGALSAAGSQNFQRGDWRGAIERWRAAMPPESDAAVEAALWIGIAQARALLGEKRGALQSLKQAKAQNSHEALVRLLVARISGSSAATASNVSPALVTRTRLDRILLSRAAGSARAHEELRALANELRAGGKAYTSALVLTELAALESERDGNKGALLLKTAGQALAGSPPSHAVLSAQVHIGLKLFQRDSRAAGELLVDAGMRAHAMGAHRAASDAWGELAELYLQADRPQEGLQAARRALRSAEAAREPSQRHRWHAAAAQAHSRLGQDEAALTAFRGAFNTLQQTRAETAAAGGDARLLYNELNSRTIIRDLTDALLRAARRERDEQLRQDLLLEARARLDDATAESIQEFLEDECVAAQRVVAPDSVPEAVVVYPVLLGDRLELIVSENDRTRLLTVAVSPEELRATANRFRREVQRRSTRRYRRSGASMYDWIVRPLGPLDPGKTVVFVPSGIFHGLPFSALFDDQEGRHLIEQTSVAIAPGLTLIEPRALPPELAILKLGLSDPVQGYQALPQAETELAFLDARFAGERLLNAGFDTRALERELGRKAYDAVHIASHAEFGAGIDDAFVLTFDGKLGMNELAAIVAKTRFRDRPVELLSLSACQTAVGNERAALGLAGVSLKAGARSTLATLWYVNDASASRLIESFYGELSRPGARRAEALRKAQLQLIQTPGLQHPAHWSAFQMLGTWL